MDDFFDIIVVGPHLGGLLAAALLVKRGKRALLLAVPEQKEDDYWESDPHERIFTNLAGTWFLNKALDELAALPGRTRLMKPLAPSFQIIMPRRRVEIYSGDPDHLGHLAEEFNEDPKQVHRFFGTLNRVKETMRHYFMLRSPHRQRGLKGLIRKNLRSLNIIPLHRSGRERFMDLLHRYQFSPLFRAVLNSQVMAFSRLYSSNPTLTSAAHCLSIVQEGGQVLGFERPSLVSVLKSFIVDRGGVIIPDAAIRRIHRASTHVLAVHLEDKYRPYQCHHLLVNTDMRWFNEMLPEGMRDHEYSRRIQEIQAAGFHFRMHFHIRRSVVPVGMGENVLFVADPEKPLLGDNFLSLALGPHDDPIADPAGTRILTVTCRIPLAPDHLNAQRMARLEKQILERLKSLIPFIEQNLVHVSRSIIPPTNHGKAGRCPGHSWLFELAYTPMMGVSLLANTTPYPNIFLTGDEVLPGMGADGMVISGCSVADMISARATRHVH